MSLFIVSFALYFVLVRLGVQRTFAGDEVVEEKVRYRWGLTCCAYLAAVSGAVSVLLGGCFWGSKAWRSAESRLGHLRESLAVVTLGDQRGYLREGYVHGVERDSTRRAVGQWVALSSAWGDSTLSRLPYGATCLMVLDSAGDGSWRNPHSFDYGRWLRLHGLVAQVRVRRGSLVRIDSVPLAPLPLSDSLRLRLMGRLAAHVSDTVALGLMQAMTLGERAGLSPGVQASFRQSGLSHILALSGLHVGFLYGMLFFVSRFFRLDRFALRALRYGLPLVGVWLFTLLVGASPSLLRAALMLSVMALHRIALRPGGGFLALAIAGCISLLVDPLMLWDAGFQLSFCALGGILFFYRPLNALLAFRPHLLRWLWGMVCVTIAAQLGTLPITLVLFGTFPLFSVLANVLAVPLASLVMPGTLVLAFIPEGWSVGSLLGFMVATLARLLIASADLVGALPYSQLGGLTLHAGEALALGLALVLLACRMYARSIWLVVGTILLALVPLSMLVHRGMARAGEDALVVLHRYGKSFIALREGLTIRAFQDTLARRDAQLLNAYGAYIPLHMITAGGVSDSAIIERQPYGLHIRHAGKRILLATKCSSTEIGTGDSIDILIPGAVSVPQVRQLVKAFSPALVLVDGSTSSRNGEKIRAICEREHIPYHSTYDQGYWEYVISATGQAPTR